jgi:hypothetical protein
MFRTLPKGLRAPPDRAPVFTAQAARWLAFEVTRTTIFHARKGEQTNV